MIKNVWEDVHRLYANSMSFYIRDLNNCEFWYLRDILEAIPHRDQGKTILIVPTP